MFNLSMRSSWWGLQCLLTNCQPFSFLFWREEETIVPQVAFPFSLLIETSSWELNKVLQIQDWRNSCKTNEKMKYGILSNSRTFDWSWWASNYKKLDMVKPNAESSYMLHVCEKSKTNLAASWPRSVMRFFVRYSSVYLDEVSHYGNLPSKVQKLKKTIFVYLSSSGSMEIRILLSRNGLEWCVRIMSVWLKWADQNGIRTKSLFNTISQRRSNFQKRLLEGWPILKLFLVLLKNRGFVW